MLFKVSRRFRTKNFNKTSEKYVLYLKWGKRAKHRSYASFDTKEEAIKAYQNVSGIHTDISEDYRVRLIKQAYSEEAIHVPSVKELLDEFPELKGTWKI